MKGINQQLSKRNNRNVILKLITLFGPLSRIELAKMSGLTKMSLTNIVNEFIEEGIVYETKKRRPIPVEILPKTVFSVGVYISRSAVEGCVIDLKGQVQFSTKIKLSKTEDAQSLKEKIILATSTVMDSGEYSKIWGIGVSTIGPMDIQNGIILSPPHFFGIRNFNVKAILEENFDYPVFVDNDMNTSAIAEKYYGYAKDVENFVYVGVSNGIGAGIVANNSLYYGDSNFSGEVGHISINFNGEKCACGNIGCLELYASIPNVEAHARELTGEENIDFNEILNRCEQGDSVCLGVIDRMCYAISFGIINVANLFDPYYIFLGHEMGKISLRILDILKGYLKDRVFSSSYKNVHLRISKFVDQSPLIGAAALVFDRTLSSKGEF